MTRNLSNIAMLNQIIRLFRKDTGMTPIQTARAAARAARAIGVIPPVGEGISCIP